MGELLLDQEMKEEALEAYEELIPHLNVPYLKFQCANCGFRPADLQWQCPQCRKWDTIGFMDSEMVDSTSSEALQSADSELSEENPEEEA